MAKIIQKIERDTPKGRVSSIYVNGEYVCKSLELPYKDNQPYISSIPIGNYIVRRSHFYGGKNKGKACLRFDDVPNRSGILVHSANTIDELQGCIAPGTSILEQYKYTSFESRKAFKKLFSFVDDVNDWQITQNEKNEVFRQKKNINANLLLMLCLLMVFPVLLR